MGLFSLIRSLTGCAEGSLSFNYGYNISKGKVYYKQPLMQPLITMETADAETFKVISNPNDTAYGDNFSFGTDKTAVYYHGRKIQGSDGPTFELLKVNYSKDKSQVYYKGWQIAGADPKSFFIKDDNYSGDKSHLFRRTETIDNDNSVFESFNDGSLVRTLHTVTVSDSMVSIPAGATFRYLAYNYFAINDQVYFYNSPLPGATTAGFAALDIFYVKTARYVYYKSDRIEGADPATFKVLDSPYGPYAKDEAHIFYNEKMIEGSDAKSFEIINKNYECGRDNHAIYFQGKPVKNFTKADLLNTKACVSCDEENVHFAE